MGDESVVLSMCLYRSTYMSDLYVHMFASSLFCLDVQDDDKEQREKEERDAMRKSQILIERSNQEEKLLKESAGVLRHFARLYLKKIQDILESQKKKSKKKGKGGSGGKKTKKK